MRGSFSSSKTSSQVLSVTPPSVCSRMSGDSEVPSDGMATVGAMPGIADVARAASRTFTVGVSHDDR